MRIFFSSTSNMLHDGLRFGEHDDQQSITMYTNLETAKKFMEPYDKIYYMDTEIYGVEYEEILEEDNYFKSIEDVLYNEGLNIPITGANFTVAKKFKDMDVPVETVIRVMKDLISQYSRQRGKSIQGIKSLRYFENAVLSTHQKGIKSKAYKNKFSNKNVSSRISRLEDKYSEK